ncbi:MAG: relaxase/mobilization nuclease domain-containing protein [Lawsonibacter sp.]|nr:relaxase/mobilization nuclease domain-containing protein [Lawsonibacter sp.]
MAVLKVKYDTNPTYKLQTGAKKYHDNASLEDVISYVLLSEKTPHHFIGGYSVNLNQAALEMKMLAYAYGKDYGVRLRHFVLSFSCREARRFHPYIYETLYKIGGFTANYYRGEYQIIFAVHEKPENPHIHFVMNTVNYMTGKKYRADIGDYHRFQAYVGKFLMEQYGLELMAVKDHYNSVEDL